MSDAALLAQGCTIKIGDGTSPEVFTTIPECSVIGGPSGSATVIDSSDLNSSAREKKLGLMDEGQVQLELNYLPDNAQHEALRVARANKTLKHFKITFTDTSPKTTFSFSAYVSGFPVNASVDQLLKVNPVLEISGLVTKA